jgi:hypothetical protein
MLSAHALVPPRGFLQLGFLVLQLSERVPEPYRQLAGQPGE